MLKKWAKILPYFIVIKLSKRFSGEVIHTKELGECRSWRLDKGEWVLWSQQNYDRMRSRENANKETKLEIKKRKILKKLDKDFSLKEEIKKEFDYEEQQRKEEFEM